MECIMTKYKSIQYIILLLLPVVMGSCYYLDKKPDNLLTEDMIWQTRANAESYLHNIYGYMHYTDGGDYASIGAADESSVSIPSTNVRQMVAGNWSAASNYFYNWGWWYVGIRQTFVLEANIDKVPLAEMSDD